MPFEKLGRRPPPRTFASLTPPRLWLKLWLSDAFDILTDTLSDILPEAARLGELGVVFTFGVGLGFVLMPKEKNDRIPDEVSPFVDDLVELSNIGKSNSSSASSSKALFIDFSDAILCGALGGTSATDLLEKEKMLDDDVSCLDDLVE